MIRTKADLKYYLLCDKIAMGKKRKHPQLFRDDMWRFQILYRKTEYYYNNRTKVICRIMYLFNKYKLRKKCRRLNSEIPLNVFEEGLVIWHGQNIIVNGNARVGKNFSISAGCVIGQAKNKTPVIADNCEMCLGSAVIGGIKILNDVTIGAKALIVKDIDKPYSTWGGVPAKCISYNINEYVEEKKKRLNNILKN